MKTIADQTFFFKQQKMCHIISLTFQPKLLEPEMT